MGRKTLTSANSIIMLTAVGLFDTPVQLQGFAAEDIFDAEAFDTAETVLGADGIMSAGWLPNMSKQGYTIQADSDSIDFFEQLYAAQQLIREVYWLNATITLSAVSKEYTMSNGVLRNYKPLPDAKKILQPRKFSIDWTTVTAAPI